MSICNLCNKDCHEYWHTYSRICPYKNPRRFYSHPPVTHSYGTIAPDQNEKWHHTGFFLILIMGIFLIGVIIGMTCYH